MHLQNDIAAAPESSAAEPSTPLPLEAPWWVAPHAGIAFIMVPAAILAHFYHSPYVSFGETYYTGFYAAIFIIGLALIAAGSFLVSRLPMEPPERTQYVAFGYLDALAALAMLAYVVWFKDLILSPGLLMGVLDGDKMNLRNDISTLPGVTTLTQLGVPYATMYGLNLMALRSAPRRHHLFFAILGAATLLRSVAWSERLAVMEYFLPLVVWVAIILYQRRSAPLRMLLNLAPCFFIFGSFFFFSIFEYFRSWIYFENSGTSFFGRMFDRWVLYYSTSMNNGAALIQLNEANIPDFHFANLLAPVYGLPGIGPVFAQAMQVDPDFTAKFLNSRGLSDEFNVFTGVYPILFDLGPLGGALFCLAFGGLIGLLYKKLLCRQGSGMIVFPTLFVAMLEILRIDYLFTTRYVYPVVACTLGFLAFMRSTRAPDDLDAVLDPGIPPAEEPPAGLYGRVGRRAGAA